MGDRGGQKVLSEGSPHHLRRAVWALSLTLIFLVAAVPSAQAISSHDQHSISVLRSVFGVDASRAGDAQLARILDAPEIGPSIEGDLTCAFVGQHALDGTGVARVEVETLLNEFAAVLAADQFANPLIIAGGGDAFAAQFIVELHDALGGLHSALDTFVSSGAYLESDWAYRSWLSQYHGDEVEGGMSAAEARHDVEETAGSALAAITQPRRISKSQLFSQFEYASGCMQLVQRPDLRDWYAGYIAGIVETIANYEKGIGLTLVPVGSDYFEAVNSGKGTLSDVRVKDAAGHTIGEIDRLGSGEDEVLALAAGESTAAAVTVSFSVNGVPDVETDYANVKSNLFVGDASAAFVEGSGSTAEFDIDQGPFAAFGSSPSYKWSFGEGADATTVHATHAYACYGEHKATFTAASSLGTESRTANVYVPPPFGLDWTTSTGEYAVAPGVPITFQADSPIPNGDEVNWSFGDGQFGHGTTVTHTFQSAAINNVTMTVTTPGCPGLSESNLVTVGRADTWVPLSGTIGNRTLRSSVAGYVINGPVTIAKGATLTVQPGTNVKFSTAAGELGQLLVNGSLKVAGEAGAPAVFTSKYDDAAGGHCSCAPVGPSPGSGDWYGITVRDGGVADLDHAEVRFARVGLELPFDGAQLTVENSVLSDASVGLRSEGRSELTVDSSEVARDGVGLELKCFGCSNTPKLRNVTFADDTTGVWVRGNTAAEISGAGFQGVKTPVVLESTATRTRVEHSAASAGGFIEVQEGSLPTGVVRLDSDLPYAFFGQVSVPAAGQLALAPGTIVKFANTGGGVGGGNAGQLLVRGSLVASGTPARPVFLTSPYDDSVGGHCGCVKSGTPLGGDWFGVLLSSGANATLDYTHVLYARDDLEAGSGTTVQIANSELSHADAGLHVTGVSSVAVTNSSASNDNTGMQFDCFGCSYTAQVTNVVFNADGTGIGISGNASAVIHASSFGVEDHWGVFNAGNASVDARGNWWGAPSGPRPSGTGAMVVGSVAYQPFCPGSGQCTSVSAAASPATIEADGRATTTITATVSRPTDPVAGEHVCFTSDDPDQSFGPVADNGDGTYTTTLTSSRSPGTATVTAVHSSINPTASGTLTVTQVAQTVDVFDQPGLAAGRRPCDGLATATVSGQLSGENVSSRAATPPRRSARSPTTAMAPIRRRSPRPKPWEPRRSRRAITLLIRRRRGRRSCARWLRDRSTSPSSPTSIAADGQTKAVATMRLSRAGNRSPASR